MKNNPPKIFARLKGQNPMPKVLHKDVAKDKCTAMFIYEISIGQDFESGEKYCANVVSGKDDLQEGGKVVNFPLCCVKNGAPTQAFIFMDIDLSTIIRVD